MDAVAASAASSSAAPIRLAFVSKADPDSGNFCTARRICDGLICRRPSWSYKIAPITDAATTEEAQSAERLLLGADVLLCLHLYRCAPIIASLEAATSTATTAASCAARRPLPPLIGIAGGTDLNVDSACPDRRAAMRRLVLMCRHVVVFSNSMRQSLAELMQESFSQLSVATIPQGIPSVLLTQQQQQQRQQRQQRHAAMTSTGRYFVVLGRIRPVKNCSSLLEPFSRWRRSAAAAAATTGSGIAPATGGFDVQLLFVGDIEDSVYGAEFKTMVDKLSPHVRLVGGVGHPAAMELTQGALALINCSLSEGQSNSVLEAMALGVPVIVSSIPGNLDIVKHLETGLVYHNDEELVECMDTVHRQDDKSRRQLQQMRTAAKSFVQRGHSASSELNAYAALISDCCRARSDIQ